MTCSYGDDAIENITWADVNGDGRADMLCSSQGLHYVFITTEELNLRRSYTAVNNELCNKHGDKALWTDFNGDGKLDFICNTGSGKYDKYIAMSNSRSLSLDYQLQHEQPLNILLENKRTLKQGFCARQNVEWMDLNGDGMADLICSSSEGKHVFLSNGKDVIMLNSAQGLLRTTSTQSLKKLV
jgi:hypothetical protein